MKIINPKDVPMPADYIELYEKLRPVTASANPN